MNLKTTLALLILLAAGAGLYWTGLALPPALDPLRDERPAPVPDAGSRAILGALKPADFKSVEVQRGAKERTVLTRTADGSWVMPGNWPTRSAEVRHLLDTLAGLRSRFAPIAADDNALDEYGLKKPAVTVVLKTTGGEHRLAFADATDEEAGTRFDRPTYLRVDDKPKVLRLGPGLVALLDRPGDYYQQRRLFPFERVPREEGATGRVDRLAGTKLEVREGKELKYVLVKGENGWELSEPYRDALDPRSRDALLEALPDIWAERFLPPEKAKNLKELGLQEPDRILTVTRPDGGKVTLEVGKPSLSTPPVPKPGADGKLSTRSYAKLKGFDRVFEIDSGRLDPVYVSLDTLRDTQLARFKSEDAREIDLTTRKGSLVLRNTAPPRKKGDTGPAPKGEWKLVKPVEAAADSALVDKLLNTLSGLSAIEKDVAEKARTAARDAGPALPALAGAQASLVSKWLTDPARLAKSYGLDAPSATIAVKVEESKGDDKPPVKRTVTLRLGRHEKISKKLFARSQSWPRINEIDDALAELILDKTALDYRGKRMLDFLSFDVERIEIRRLHAPWLGLILYMASPGYSKLSALALAAQETHPGGFVALQRTPSGWSLTAPVKAEADGGKANDLADKLGKLEVLTFVADKAEGKQLQGHYGLGIPAVRVTVSFADVKKKPRTLLIGRQRPGAPGYFAKLEDAPEIFAVGSDLHDQLERDSLAYRPGTLWQIDAGDDIVKLRIHKAGQEEYQLERKGEKWQVSGPFTVAAPRAVVDKLTTALQAPKAEEYRAHSVTDFAPYGLASPEVKLTVTTKKGKQYALSVGRPTKTGPLGTLSRLGNGSAVFVIGDALAKTVDQSALDFLDRDILKFDSGAVTSVVRQRGQDVLEMVKKDDAWQIVKPAAEPADEKKVPELLKELADLKALRIAAFRPKDTKAFGLEKPEATVTIKLGADAKPSEHVLELGKEADAAGDRFAQVKGGQTVAVLSAAVVKKLLAGPLTYRDHALARLPDADVIKLESGERKATFAKPEGSWKLTQPISADADHDALEGFLNGLARLRADELVAEKPTEEQLKTYGLDKPAARWQFLSGDKVALDLSVGAAERNSSRRYARLAGKDLVFLLDAKLSGQALAEYRPRTVFKDNIDPAQIESVRFGYRKDPFELKKMGGAWEVVGKPDAKVNAMSVSDALSVLRDLKLERYVKDAGADLKLFGLDPPELVLEVTTPAGKHVLYVGGLEGTSKRRYARLPVKGPADVFVLDEAASSKLVRDLASLTKAP
jgi:hypothetical protein